MRASEIARLNRRRHLVRACCARGGACGCRGIALCRAPRLLVISQEMGADFAMGLGLLGSFRQVSFAVDFGDLGKRRRVVAFWAGSACEIAQKLQVRFACVEGVVS